MKRLLAIFAALAALSAMPIAQTPPLTSSQGAALTDELANRYSDWMNAFRRRDGATMDRMEADGLMLVFHEGTIWSKQRSRVEDFKGHDPAPYTHTLEHVYARVDGDIAILTGVQNDVNTKDGKKTRTAFTSVWRHERGDWRVWSGHWSDRRARAWLSGDIPER
jgi:ketosteroid isomerase-like protein